MSLKDKKVFRLIEYAEKLGIRDEVMKYVRFKRPVLIHYFKFFEVCENINNFLKSF